MSDDKQLARSSDTLNADRAAKRSKQTRFCFPGRHQNGAANVYRKLRGYRDNSLFLEKLFNAEETAICFTRPMQLGKTTLFSLADELFSINKESNVDTDLSYSVGEDDRNHWYVLRLDFGSVCPSRFENSNEEEEWVQRCKRLDDETACCIKMKVIVLLSNNPQLEQNFQQVSLGVEIKDQSIANVIRTLGTAVQQDKGRLLSLVDEYDQPFREGLLHLIPLHGERLYERVQQQIKLCFSEYFAFFRSVKVLLEEVSHAKIWLTGITPIGIREMGGLNIEDLTYQAHMADAVGLTEADVERMLEDVHAHAPFKEGELELAKTSLKRNFNNLRFPESQPLYHTGLVNHMMNMLLDPTKETKRREFLSTGKVPEGWAWEPVPSSLFNVLCNAKNLRPVANKLANGETVSGPRYKIKEQLSLENLLQETIDISDYLTLLVHIGVVSASGTSTDNPTFTITSEFYRENLLKPLLKTLRASLEKLVALESAEDLYAHGEEILVDFVTSISQNNMARLMAWASSDSNDHILELQFQSHVVTEAHGILQDIARTSQEDKLPATGKRTDVTFSSDMSVVILELKQVASETPPTADFVSRSQEQLAGYVKTRQAMEDAGKGGAAAGFVVIIH